MNVRVAAVIALAFAFVAGALATTAFTNNAAADSAAQPADKMAVAGSAFSLSGPGKEVTLLTGTIKTSSPTDAVVTVSLECDILTNVTTVGNDDQKAFGQVEVWVEIDGSVLPVSSDDTVNTGHVVFCNRAHQQTTSGFQFDSNATISSFLQTRSSNTFSWIGLNLGSDTHQVTVKATLTQTATNQATAQAAIGKRTLVVEPVKLANNAVI